MDGINVIDGKEASHDGQGYVLNGGQTVEIPGWRRDDNTVAAFKFSTQDESYSSQVGKGTSNVGVVGVAVFDEKAPVYVPRPPTYWWGSDSEDSYPVDYLGSPDVTCSTADSGRTPRSYSGFSIATRRRVVREVQDVGTGYGQETSFHTTTTKFERNTLQPREVAVIRYATKERLKSWGVPVDDPTPTGPNPFPATVAQHPSVPAPPGWRR